MPYIITGEPSTWKNIDYGKEEHNYTYPEGLNLKPGSELHNSIRDRIWWRACTSRNEIQKRFDSWREIDRTLTTYIPIKDAEDKLKDKDSTKPISIVFPYSYASLEGMLTYLVMAFFQDPVFKYEGVESVDTIGAALMELLIRLHCIKSKVPLNLHTMFRDGMAYGISAVIPEWVRKFGKKAVRSSVMSESPIGSSEGNSINFIDDILFEGNALSNIEPYKLLMDPSVSSIDVQKGEFFGWVERDNYMNLLTEESQRDSGMFNVKYLRSRQNKKSVFSLDESDRNIKFGTSSNPYTSDYCTNPVDRIKMYVNLIPKEWKLSESEVPEKWFFEVDSDDVVVRCEQANHNHGMYPVAIASPEFDGYSMTPIGRLEIAYGLQNTLDFLFNSHIANVRKAVNDMLVVDPYLVNIEDLKDPQPGKLIRLRKPAWGRGVDKVVQQLGIQDITRLNVQDAGYVTGMMDRILGTDQSMQGVQRQGGPERLTSAEFQGTRSSSVSRLQRVALIISLQAMYDIGNMFAVHTQQYTTKATYVKAVGRYAEELIKKFNNNKIKVSPRDLSIDYDVIPHDGSVPGGSFSGAWLDLFKTIGTSEILAPQFDVVRLFEYIAYQLGAKNVSDFKKSVDNTNVVKMPDEQVLREAERGNMIPANMMGGMQ
jgi:hypothetical protein